MRTLRGRLYLLVILGGAVGTVGCKKEAPPPPETGSADTAAVAPALLEGEGLTGRAVGAGLAILAGLACVIVGERRQQGQVPVGAVVAE